MIQPWDRAARFYNWLGGIASVGVVLLLTTASSAVPVLFSRKERGGSRFRRHTASALRPGGLLLFLGIILLNLLSLVEGPSCGPLSIGMLVLLGVDSAAGPLRYLTSP